MSNLRSHLIGQRIRLVHTADPHTLLRPGDEGVVTGVDSLGTLSVKWDSGSCLGLIPEEDRWLVIPESRKDGFGTWDRLPVHRLEAGDAIAFTPGDAPILLETVRCRQWERGTDVEVTFERDGRPEGRRFPSVSRVWVLRKKP